MVNLLLYDHALSGLQIVLNSLNTNTTTNISLAVSSGIDRLGLMFTNKGSNKIPFMLKNSGFNKYNWFTDALINFLITNNIKNVDIISCNMKNASLITEINSIWNQYGITINLSVDKTGNIDGGDWIMELSNNPNVNNLNIRSLYFTDNILTWKFVLDPLDLITYLLSKNCLRQAGLNYKLTKNITIDFSVNIYSSTLTDNQVFDGNGHTIRIINSGLVGLFATNVTNPINIVVIKNLIVRAPSTYNGGIVIGGNNYFKVYNCKFYGYVQGIFYSECYELLITGSGGICGFGCNNFTIDKCNNYKSIGHSAGGICGYGCQNFTIKNCKNFGKINVDYSGGICGSGILSFNVSINQENTVYNCINYAKINGENAGGIYGGSCGNVNYTNTTNTTNIINCKNKGIVDGTGAGGICGAKCAMIVPTFIETINSSVSNVNITKCINDGDINIECGGICGRNCTFISNIIYGGTTVNNSVCNVNITSCINNGNIVNIGGGIIGRFSNCSTESNNIYTGDNPNATNIVINDCISNGYIHNGSGGLVGPDLYPQIDDNNIIPIIDAGYATLSINHCIVNGKTDSKSGGYLGNNCSSNALSGTSIVIHNSKLHKHDKPYINLVAGTTISIT